MRKAGQSQVGLFGAALTLVLAGCAALASPSAAAGPLQVRDVRVAATKSLPAHITLQVDGVLPDACTKAGSVSQHRDGRTVVVAIMTERSGDMCAQVVQNVTVSVKLDGTFGEGTYTIRVNGVEKTVTV